MKHTLLASALFVSATLVGSAQAATGTITITGSIIDKGCDIQAGSQSLDVDLGTVDASTFEGKVGSTLGSAPLKIALTGCPETGVTGVSVVFDGPASTDNTELLAITAGETSAKGVGVAFYESDSSTLIPLHKPSAVNAVAEGQTDVTLNYVAKYMSTADTVVGGGADATANFTLIYN